MSSAELQSLVGIITIIQGIFFIVSVFFIWYQIRQHNRLTRAAQTQSLVEISSPS